jgi:hypothetical protein
VKKAGSTGLLVAGLQSARKSVGSLYRPAAVCYDARRRSSKPSDFAGPISDQIRIGRQSERGQGEMGLTIPETFFVLADKVIE